MAEFILIIKGGLTDYSDAAKTAAHMQEWYTYGGLIQQQAKILGGAGLTFEGRVVGNAGTQAYAPHGPETLTGYYHLEAPDLATVEALAAQAPNIGLGGTVEVRLPLAMPQTS